MGPTGPTGPAGADVTTGTVDAKQLTFNDLTDRALGGKVLSVDTSGNQPVVTFQVYMKDSMQGVRGLGNFALHIAQLKPAVNGSASYWQNYIAAGLPQSAMPAAASAPSVPSTDAVSTFNADGTVKAQGYSVTDNNDGTYVVKFGANIKANTNVPYDASLVHRVVVGVRSVATPGVAGLTPGAYAGPANPLTGGVIAQFTNTNGANLVYDFTPAASGPGAMLTDTSGKQMFARDNVSVDACNQCHYKIQYGFPRGNNTSGHFGSRVDTKTCVMCHTPQLQSGAGDFTNFIHKIHMGEELAKQETVLGVNVNEVKYPQDQRLCSTCHQGTVKDSWNLPTAKACGACHNSLNFTTGENHVGKAQPDSTCAMCHSNIAADHLPVAPPDPNNIYDVPNGGNNNTNASYTAAGGIVPPGAAKITYAVSSVTRAANGNPSIVFKLVKDGKDVVFNNPASASEMMDGFVGSPSVYFAWSVAQDGIAAPADYNATASTYIKNMWRGDGKDVKGVALAAAAVGTMTGPVGGYYTITLTGVNVPSTAKMLTGGVGYTYGLGTTQPLTQINLEDYPYEANPSTVNSGVGGTGGLSVPPPNVWKVATGFTGRRLIVDNAKCNTCHEFLGVKPTFHAGQRNDAQTCTFCHSVNRTNSGWPVNINYDVHAIHSAALRQNKFSWEASAGAKYWEIGYPGLLKNCEMCHIAGMYDFSATNATTGYGANASLVSSLLMTTAASGTINAAGFPIITGNETITSSSSVISPFVTPGTNYGAVFSFNAATGVSTPAADTTLVLSPVSAACSGCHDSRTARAHMQANGGTVFGPRSDARGNTEQCLVCHGPANNALFNDTVPAIKAVHRWW
jgi:OmcA/MtrC family decaheme c-type cytochrome